MSLEGLRPEILLTSLCLVISRAAEYPATMLSTASKSSRRFTFEVEGSLFDILERSQGRGVCDSGLSLETSSHWRELRAAGPLNGGSWSFLDDIGVPVMPKGI